jgi:LuxR family maltose regulon positive regulatory protein
LTKILYNDYVTESLLRTKLHIPSMRSSFVPRPRLIDRLNAGLDGRLSLISAPAGYGKTTLVTEWLSSLISDPSPPGRAEELRAAWLSLDEADNDPTRFLAYLIAAVQQVHSDFGISVQALLRSPQPPPTEALLTAVVNELAAVPVSFILVLDDYHVIHSLPIHQQLSFLLEHQPATMYLVVMTREDPLLPIPRLRARGQVLEIRQKDLRFTVQETADFLERVMGVGLSPENVAALEQRTEGWIAGLQLAALSMQGMGDPKGFIQSFTGSNRYILDYLIEEVFERQTQEVKDFLLKTSILEQLSAPLCDALTEQTGSQKILEALEQANLFIVPLDQSRTWYRYHHLFAELLHQTSRRANFPQAALHQRASQWYESMSLFGEAVEHSLAAQDWGNAARLIGAVSESMTKHGETVTLLSWFDKLPREVVTANPNLGMVFAWAAVISSRFDVAAPLLEHLEQIAEPGSLFLGQVAAAQAVLARSKRDNARTIEKSEQALSLLSDTDVAIRGIIAMNLGLAYWHEGHLAEAEPALMQAIDLCGKAGNYVALLTAQAFLVKVAGSRGKLHQAAEMAEELIRVGGQAPILCLVYGDLAVIHHEWNNMQKAWEYFEQAFVLSERSGNVEFQQALYLSKAILTHAQGDDAGAITALAEADRMGRDFPAVIRSRSAAFGVQLALARNDPTMLSHWLAQVKAEVDSHSFYRFMGLTIPRLYLAQGKKDEAAKALKSIHETASRSGWGYGMIVVRISQSLAAKTTVDAMPFISDALRLGQPEDFICSFAEVGPDLVPVLQEAIRRGIEPEYAGRILNAMGAGQRSVARAQAGHVEPLSEREIEVLRLVSAGLSNREIARKLFISPGTAKTHIHNLCGKLGVRNRTEAAMRAKELGLV